MMFFRSLFNVNISLRYIKLQRFFPYSLNTFIKNSVGSRPQNSLVIPVFKKLFHNFFDGGF